MAYQNWMTQLKSRQTPIIAAMSIVCAVLCAGCAEGYTAPAGGADLMALGSGNARLDLADPRESPRPLATFPATIAAVRVQDRNFRSSHERAYGRGEYAIVATRDVEVDHTLAEFASLPMVNTIVPLNHLAVSNEADTATGLRQAARSAGADMLLIYTLDSATDVDHHVPELSVVTLGLLPEGEARATCTASAILLDARTGYLYALSEGTDQQKRLASAWSSDSSRDKARRSAERKAFHQMITDLKARWQDVVRQYAPNP